MKASEEFEEIHLGLTSKWNITPDQGLYDKFLQQGFENFIQQEQQAKEKNRCQGRGPFHDVHLFVSGSSCPQNPILQGGFIKFTISLAKCNSNSHFSNSVRFPGEISCKFRIVI